MNLLDPIQQLADKAPYFILVLFRVAGLMFWAPLLGMNTIPSRIKIFVALVLAVAVFPLVPTQVIVPDNLIQLTFSLGSELLIGAIMGFTLMVMFAGAHVGAELVSQQMGWGLARLIDPTTDISYDVLTQLYSMLATLIYVLINGHLILIRSLAQTFKTIPLMAQSYNDRILELLTAVFTGSFQLGIRIAGPALTAIFLATLALGFVSRTMPQLNILAAGFPVRISLALLLLIASLGMVLALFHQAILDAFSYIGILFI